MSPLRYCYEHGNAVYHDAIVDEAPSVPCRLQVRVLFRAGDADVPHLLPGLVELQVHWVHARVVRGHRVAQPRGDAVLLQPTTGGTQLGTHTGKKTFSKELFKAFVLHKWCWRSCSAPGRTCTYGTQAGNEGEA